MTTPANTPVGNVVGAAWADNMPLATLNTYAQAGPTSTVATQHASDSQRFWATPNRPASDQTLEVMQITLSSPRLINEINLYAAQFPQVITVEYFDDPTGSWLPCLDPAAPMPVSQTILTSFPAILPMITNVTGHVHPQHSFSGHWKNINFTVRPFTARLLRVLLKRTTQGTPPTNPFGTAVDYSLAISNFYVGYQVSSINDVPDSTPFATLINTDGTFASTTDLLGSPVSYKIITDVASNVLRNESTEQSVIWKCEPQPVPWAVVNFYLDARDPSGNPQVMDRFYLEPIYTGPAVHIYYSNDNVSGDYAGITQPLAYPFAQIFDPDGVGGDVLHSGLNGVSAVAFVDIDNQVLSFDASQSWWLGMSLNFKLGHGTEIVDSPLLDCGAFSVAMTPFGFACTTQYGDTLAVNVDAFDPATTVTLLVAYDGDGNLTLSAKQGQTFYSESIPLPVPLTGTTVNTLRVGGFQGDQPGVNNCDFNGLVLKTDTVPDMDTVIDFLSNPEPYIVIADFQVNADPRSNNSLLRYHQNWASDSFPAGFVGGEPDRFSDLIWSPIARDFVLMKGYYDVPPTKAKYWKFEFTNLVPESYEVYKPITRVVQTYPTGPGITGSSVQTFAINATTPVAANLTAVYQVNQALTAQFDANQSTQTGTGAAQLGLTPTQARVILDSNSRINVGNAYWAWNFLPTSSTTTAPSFTQVGVHVYERVNIQQTAKIAYFVGLSAVVAYRLDALATSDVMRYVDNFFDLTNIDEDTNFILAGDHQLTSGGSSYAVVQSEPFSSSRIVTGIQFATQQSDPVQRLPDADFNDATHANWTVVGDATFAPGITVDATVGNTLQVSRASLPLTWDLVTAAYPIYQNVLDLNLSWGEIATAFENPQLQGGVTSAPIAVPPGGRVSVAARVIAAGDLAQQLWVQIIDDATQNVLSEEPITVKAHQITEWFTSYSIGDLATPPWRWQDFFPAAPTANFFDSFVGANAAVLPTMDTGQHWQNGTDLSGNPTSLAIVSNKAVSTKEGNQNFLDVNSIWGTLEFIVGAMGPASQVNFAPNPIFATNTTGWTTVNSATLTRVLTGVNGASTSGQIKSTQATLSSTMVSTTTNTVIAGVNYVFAADFMQSGAGLHGNLQINWMNSSNALVSSVTNIFNAPAGVWTHQSFGLQAPAGAVTAILFVDGGIMPVNATFNVTNIVFSASESILVSFDPFYLDDQGILMDHGGTSLAAVYQTNVLTTSNTARVVQANDDIRIDILPTYLVPGGRQDIAHAANPDPVAFPYSLMFYINGTWVRTVSHDLGARLTRSIKGHLNQQFASWSWSPFPYGQLPGAVLMFLPRLDNGFWVDNVTFTQFQDADENIWNATGTWDLSTPVEAPGDNFGPPLTAASNGSTFAVDTGVWYGALSAFVRNVAGSVAGPTHGNVLVLDADNGIFLDHAGHIVNSIGSSFGTLISGAIPNNSMVTVQWARTSQVSATTRGSINATTFPDMLIAKINGQIVGTFASSMLQVWRGTRRGVAGDIYDPTGGTRPTAPNYTLDTSFRAFHWAPDASTAPVDSTKPTWDDVTSYGSTTYDHVRQGRVLSDSNLRAQLVQFGESDDTWEVDNLSMFVDPIVWSFSNDGGNTFYPAPDIKNNPRGVLTFPQSTVVTQLGLVPGTAMVWRATCYLPGQTISSLVIRPWYAGLLSNVLRRIGLGVSGPNLMPYDQTPTIEQDPSFQVWSKPIPQSWWYQFQALQRAQTQQTTSSTGL